MINPEKFKDKAIAIAAEEETEVKFIAALLLDKNGKSITTWRLENADMPAMFNIIGQLERIKAQTLIQI